MKWHELWRAEIESTETTVTVTLTEHDGRQQKLIVQRQEVFELLVKWGLV